MRKILLLSVLIFSTLSFQKKEFTWVAIGDSITYLNDHPDETGNRVKKGYMTLVTEQLPNIKYVNQGYNGWTAGLIADNIDKLKLTSAEVYTIFLGTNDWWAGRPIGTLADYQNSTGSKTLYGSFKIILDKLKSLNKGAKIMLITPLQRGDFVYLTNFKNNAYGSYKAKKDQHLSQLVDAILEIGKTENLTVIDLYNKSGITLKKMVKFKRLKDPKTGKYKNFTYPEYIDIPFNPDTDEYPYPLESVDMTYDGLHPSEKGNALICKMLYREMKKF